MRRTDSNRNQLTPLFGSRDAHSAGMSNWLIGNRLPENTSVTYNIHFCELITFHVQYLVHTYRLRTNYHDDNKQKTDWSYCMILSTHLVTPTDSGTTLHKAFISVEQHVVASTAGLDLLAQIFARIISKTFIGV